MDAVLLAYHVRLLNQIAREQEACAYVVLIKICNEVPAVEAGSAPNGYRKTKPRRVRTDRCFRQLKEFYSSRQTLLQMGKVGAAPIDESREFVKLRNTAGRLHVGDFKIITTVGVYI